MTNTILKSVIVLAIALLLGCQPQPRDASLQNNNPAPQPHRSTTRPAETAREDSQPKPVAMSADSDPSEGSPNSVQDADTRTPPDNTTTADSTFPVVSQPAPANEGTPQNDSPSTVPLVGPPIPQNHTEQQPAEQQSPPTHSDDESLPDDSAHDDNASVEKDKTAGEIHETFTLADQIFKTYVDKNGNVDYSTLRRKRSQLYNVARAFDQLDPADYLPWSKQQKTAFWINAFNIFTLKTVVDNYPIQPRWYMINYPKNSIIQLQSPWSKLYFDVMDIQYTLREIERDMLLKKFKDMRICFALSYATLGGAFLRNEAYSPDRLDRQLDEQVARYLKDPRGMKIVASEQTVCLGDIFNWYRNEFTDQFSEEKKFRQFPQPLQSYLTFILQHVSEKDNTYLQSGDFTVKFQRYDWQLNEQPNGN